MGGGGNKGKEQVSGQDMGSILVQGMDLRLDTETLWMGLNEVACLFGKRLGLMGDYRQFVKVIHCQRMCVALLMESVAYVWWKSTIARSVQSALMLERQDESGEQSRP